LRKHIGAAALELGAQTDKEIDTGRTGDGLAQIGAERLARDAADDFADQESQRRVPPS
jgi:hypothetical protein